MTTTTGGAEQQMYSIEAEMSVLGGMLIDATAVPRVCEVIQGEAPEKMFFKEEHRHLYKAMLAVWGKHGQIEPVTLSEELRNGGLFESCGGAGYMAELWDYVPTAANIDYHARIVRDKYVMREVARIGEGMVKAATTGKYLAQDIVDRALTRLTSVVVQTQPQKLRTREDFVANEIQRMSREVTVGAPMPYSKLRGLVGDFIPGDAIAIPGFSNSGKTLLLANLARHWAVEQVPAIWVPTESQEKFLSRVAASHARVPQVFPERDTWHLASEEQRESYQFALRDLENCPWQIVPQRRISPEQIIAEVSQRRREYDGLPVVVAIDHLHRLNYGGINPAFAVADATQRLRDWAGEDRHGGIILLMLYQPKKPDIDVNVYKPVTGYGISGSGQVMAELDIIMSPYRRWVKIEEDAATNPFHRTPWGTPRGKTKNGHPVASKPEAEDAKVDDEHVYVKIAKRRTGGEGPTVMLHIDSPSGHIYQIEAHDDGPSITGTHG